MFFLKLVSVVFSLVLVMSFQLTVEAQSILWAQSDGGLWFDSGNAIAVDSSGNCYVAGGHNSIVGFGTDAFVTKYDISGNIVWSRSDGGETSDFALDIVADAIGNTYVTGGFSSTATFSPVILTSVGRHDVFVVKYDPSGDVLWARSDGGGGIDQGWGIAVDATGNSYVTGGYKGTAVFGPFVLASTRSKHDIFVVKYDPSGNVLWAQSDGGLSVDSGLDIAVDSLGNSYVTGLYEDIAWFDSFVLTSAGDSDVFVVKYDMNGNVLWARSAGGIGIDQGNGISVDSDSNSYVIGFYTGTVMFDSFILTSVSGSQDIFVAKYDPGGNVLWVKSAGGASNDTGIGITVDSFGNSYVTGSYQGVTTVGSSILTSAGVDDVFVAKYNTIGNILWVKSSGGLFSDAGVGIAVDLLGNSYITGAYWHSAIFGQFPFVSTGFSDIFVVKHIDDCNLNGVADINDIMSGFSSDCNGNGIPDECEILNEISNVETTPFIKAFVLSMTGPR